MSASVVAVPSLDAHSIQRVYIFIHGAFRTRGYWRSVSDSIVSKGSADVIMCDLPELSPIIGARDICDDMVSRYSAVNTEVLIIGHSLGAVYACFVANEVARVFNTKIFILSPPIVPGIVKKVVAVLWASLSPLITCVPLKRVPSWLLGIRTQGVPFPGILSLWHADITKILNPHLSRLVEVNIGYGLFDVLNFYGRFGVCARIKLLSAIVSHKVFVFSGHHPPKTQRSAVIRWVCGRVQSKKFY